MTDRADSNAVPQTVKTAAALVSAEVAALLAGAVILIVMAAVRTTTRLWAALAIAGFVLVAAAVLAVCVRGLLGLRPSARSPVILVQLLALPVGYSLGFQADRLAVAAPILVVAVSVLVLLMTPSARHALDRVL
jgi:hypothetical protein